MNWAWLKHWYSLKAPTASSLSCRVFKTPLKLSASWAVPQTLSSAWSTKPTPLIQAAFHLLAKTEGILPALESSHAIAQAIKLARDMPKDAIVLCNLSGRGDKDVHTIAGREGLAL